MIQQGLCKQISYISTPRGGPLGFRLGRMKSLKTLTRFQVDPVDFVHLNGEASPPKQNGEF
jgi:hypothetical protein